MTFCNDIGWIYDKSFGWCSVFFGTRLLSAITIPIYLFVLFVIITHKKKVFSHAFYDFLILTGVYDLLMLIVNITPASGPIIDPMRLIIQRLARYSSSISIVVMAANRLVTISWPTKFDEMWNNCVHRAALAIVMLGGVVAGIPLMLPCCHFYSVLNPDNKTYRAHVGDGSPTFKAYHTFQICMFFLSIVVVFVVYVSGICILIYKRLLQSSVGKLSSIEVNLCMQAMMITAPLFLCFPQMLNSVGLTRYNSILDMLYAWCYNLYYTMNPYIYLIFSSLLRGEIKKDFKRLLNRSTVSPISQNVT